ncbi:MAG: MFS transporter [Acidimicrobiales bacterium]|jgi:MFS family permease
MHVRTYRWWFFSQILSASGSTMQGVAMSWLVLKLTGSALLLALTATVMFAPSLVGGAWAGSLVDRFERRQVLFWTQSAFMVLSATFGTIVAVGGLRVWVVYVFAFAIGLVNTLDAPARQIFVLDLVGPDRAANAISLNEIVINTSRVLGPAVGGALLATVGVAACFVVNAATFLPPLAVVSALLYRRGWSSIQAPPRERRRGHTWEGLVYVWRRPALRSCVFMAVAGGMLFNMGGTLPLIATRVFHAGPEAYGAMMASFGGGALFGALLAGTGPSWPSGPRVRALVLATGLEVSLAAFSPWEGMLFVGLALAGFLSIWFFALANALVQLRSDPAVRGRVMGVWTMALPGMLPITSLLVGGVATLGGGALGARLAFGLGGLALAISGVAGWRSLADREDDAALAELLASSSEPLATAAA